MVAKLAALRALPRILPEAVICVTYSAAGVLDTDTLSGVFPCVNEGVWEQLKGSKQNAEYALNEHFKPPARFWRLIVLLARERGKEIGYCKSGCG